MKKTACLSLVLVLCLVGCGGSYSAPVQPKPEPESSPQLASLFIDYTSLSISISGSTQLIAFGDYGGPWVNVTNSATWTSSDTGVATVSKGLVVGVGNGSVTVTAEFDGKKHSRKLVVGLVPLSVELFASDDGYPLGTNTFHLSDQSQYFMANATYDDGTVIDLSRDVTWATDPADSLLFDPNEPGLATFVKVGSVTIIATPKEGPTASLLVEIVQ